MLKRLLFFAGLLAFTTACPKIERKVYTFDLKTGTGEVRFINITTDDPSKANNDFMELVNKVIQGTKLEEDNPGWRILSKELVETDGRLDGVVKFTFDDPRRIGIYQHDKKSAYIYCLRDSEESLLATNGTRIDDVLDGCVAWDRKQTELEVTVKAATLLGNEKSLLPQFHKWNAGETLELVEDPMGMLGGGLPGAGGEGSPGQALGEALGASLLGSIGSAMGLSGKLTVGDAKLDGPLSAAQVDKSINPIIRSSWQMCYGIAAAETPGIAGRANLHFTVAADGKVGDLSMDGELQNDVLAECVSERARELKFPGQSAATQVTLPLDFSPE